MKLPRYVRPRRLASGEDGYFWERPTWAKPPNTRHGRECPVVSSPLGVNLSDAIAKGNAINDAFDGWRNGENSKLVPGTIGWLFDWYRQQDGYLDAAEKTRLDYRKIMTMLTDLPMKNGGTLGQRAVRAMDAGAADALYKRLRERGERQASYAMQVCRLVWNWGFRYSKTTGIEANPFSKMRIKSRPDKGNLPASRAQYRLYREAAREAELQSMATAAALAFELSQRTWDVFGYVDEDGKKARGFLWEDYEPGVQIALTQSKTGKRHVIPLSAIDADGNTVLLYPELEEELARTPRTHPEIIIEERTGKKYTQRRVSTVHRLICDAAGLPKALTPTSFRHGGATEIGDAGEADPRSITGHTELDTTAIYNKASVEKAQRTGLMRLAHISGKNGNVGTGVGTGVGMESGDE